MTSSDVVGWMLLGGWLIHFILLGACEVLALSCCKKIHSNELGNLKEPPPTGLLQYQKRIAWLRVVEPRLPHEFQRDLKRVLGLHKFLKKYTVGFLLTVVLASVLL
jgi:hypothetical protein